MNLGAILLAWALASPAVGIATGKIIGAMGGGNDDQDLDDDGLTTAIPHAERGARGDLPLRRAPFALSDLPQIPPSHRR